MCPDESAYYRERAQIERQRAAESENPHVIEIHAKLAALYEKLIELEEQHQSTFRLVEVMNPIHPSPAARSGRLPAQGLEQA